MNFEKVISKKDEDKVTLEIIQIVEKHGLTINIVTKIMKNVINYLVKNAMLK